ncbi:MAG: lysylphosphatidylglycerol synthase transmembrane domain-containing protein [Thermoleophilaceae bacterium]
MPAPREPADSTTRATGAWRLLPVATSIACLAAVVWWAAHQRAPHLPSTAAALSELAAALALYVVATVLRAERWHRIVSSSGIAAGRSDTYALTTVGYMGNNVLPARGGELLRVWLLSRRAGVGAARVVGTLLAERTLDAVALGLLFALFASSQVGTLPGGWALLGAAAGAVLAALACAPWAMRRSRRLRSAFDAARPILGALASLRSVRGAALLGVSLALWLVEAGCYLWTARAVGIPLDVRGAVYVMAFTNFLGLLPAGPGYVGTFDGAVVVAIRATGARGAAVLGYVLLVRLVLFVPITLAGLAVLLVRYGGFAGLKQVRAVRAPDLEAGERAAQVA